MKKVKLFLNYAGYCIAKENDAIRGGRKMKIKFHALWGLIEHPEKGWILYDTGYTQRFYDATKLFPNKIYALITKVVINPEEEIKAQLKNAGIANEDIKHVIITHFHADHIAGLRDFPNATIYASQKAVDQLVKIPRAIAFSKGILKALLPDDVLNRICIIEDKSSIIKDSILGDKYDLFGDNSIQIVSLPGHAAGQIGIILETEKQTYFLIADACWLKTSYIEYVLPNPIVKLFFHSWSDFKVSLKKIHLFHKEYPSICIVPTHCYETTSVLVSNKISLDAL